MMKSYIPKSHLDSLFAPSGNRRWRDYKTYRLIWGAHIARVLQRIAYLKPFCFA